MYPDCKIEKEDVANIYSLSLKVMESLKPYPSELSVYKRKFVKAKTIDDCKRISKKFVNLIED